jgi:uracil-DNA glycosylase family 4
MMGNDRWFNEQCMQCERLVAYLTQVRQEHPAYYCKPVPPFGDAQASFVIVGLAPGKHGANASGRPFTGDYAGILLYETLFRYGFSSQSESHHRNDGLKLRNCRITNAVKCLPPENRPVRGEVENCNTYLSAELADMRAGGVVLALGTIAHTAVLRALNLKHSQFKFGHGYHHQLPKGLNLIDSYHCSRYNTQTRRLTPTMFDQVFETVRLLLSRDC